MSEQEYSDYLDFLNSIEEEDEISSKIRNTGLGDSAPVDTSDYDPE